MSWLWCGVLLGLLCSVQGRTDDDARIVAKRTTKTAVVLSTSTTTSPFTCAFRTNTQVCQRRSFRRFNPINDDKVDNTEMQLDGSQDDATWQLDDDSQRESRIALTIWTTISSTYTITATSTNSATTFSLSYYCTINGASYPPSCG
ncbi:uncharacterized protein LOC127009187 [Eriocheir sinensis]|uniref:uncharacterized protein LOC127009187 n=1 Tax=Eriocheir sinensis TaxID=95602 RepID=UPI0021C8612A|nr:uncharacterized protein LOC127009187 [Eriocheir sinensis]